MSRVPEGWTLYNFGDVLDIEGGGQPPKKFFIFEPQSGYVRLLQIRDFGNHPVPTYIPGSMVSKTCAEDDILIARYGASVGRILTGMAGAYNVAMVKVIINQAYICRSFIYYWLNADHFQRRVLSTSRSAQDGFNKDDLHTIPILLPPLAEQRRIAEILGVWDDAMALAGRLIDALKRRKQGLMQRVLTGNVRFPEFEGDAWNNTSLGDLTVPVSRPEAVDPKKTYRLIGVRWYVAGAHIHEVLPGSEIITESLSQVAENDIIYNKMWASKAAFAIAKHEHDGAVGTNEYPQFRALADKLDVYFLEFLFNNPQFQHDAKALCRGTTGRARLNPRDFAKIVINVPSVAEQTRIADFLNACQQELEIFLAYHTYLEEQKKGLMQRLLTGQIRVGA